MFRKKQKTENLMDKTVFSLEFKLQVVEEAKKTDNNHAVAKKHKIEESMLRNWRKKESKMREKAKNSIRKTQFRLPGGGRKPKNKSNSDIAINSSADQFQNIRQIQTEDEHENEEEQSDVTENVNIQIQNDSTEAPDSLEEEEAEPSKEFSCDMCDKEFFQISLLESHIVNEHLKNNSSSSSVNSTVDDDDDVSKNPPEKIVPTELEIKVENHIKQECEPETESMQPKELEIKVENDIKQECEPESESESMKPKDTSTNSFEVSDDHSESKSPKKRSFF